MQYFFKRLLLSLCGALCAAVAHAAALPGPLVDTAWLAAHLNEVQVVDVRARPKLYTAQPDFESDPATGKLKVTEAGGHIAGSRLIDMKTMRTERQVGALKVKFMIPEQADFERAIQEAGIDAGKPIVLVPVGMEVNDIDDALRVYWQFKMYGEDQLAVLDGGLAAWLDENRPVSSEAAPAKKGSWRAQGERSLRYFASTPDVAQAMARHSATLVDSRDARHFHGVVKRDYVGGYGHLEGARLYPTELMMANQGSALKFMPAASYRALFKAQDIDPSAPAITYCNSGHLSSGTWFILSELLGNAHARLYDGSLHEWTLGGRPVVGALPQH